MAEGHGEVGQAPHTEPLPTSSGSLTLPADCVPMLPQNRSAGREERAWQTLQGCFLLILGGGRGVATTYYLFNEDPLRVFLFVIVADFYGSPNEIAKLRNSYLYNS